MKTMDKSVSRVDGRLKVTGSAKYASDHNPVGLAYGVPVVSTIARGAVKAIDSSRAEKQPGFSFTRLFSFVLCKSGRSFYTSFTVATSLVLPMPLQPPPSQVGLVCAPMW